VGGLDRDHWKDICYHFGMNLQKRLEKRKKKGLCVGRKGRGYPRCRVGRRKREETPGGGESEERRGEKNLEKREKA